MKKIKIITTVAIALILLLQIIPTVCMAEQKTIDTGNYEIGSITGYSKAESKAKEIVTVLRTVGIAVAVIGILVLGVKYMAGSVEARADYKKSMMPYLIGFTITTIVTIIHDLSEALNSAA